MARPRPAHPVVDLAREAEALSSLSRGEHAIDALLSRALEALESLVPYDLAAILRLDGSTLRVRLARGKLDGPRVRSHALPLDRFPTLRRALETRRPIALSERHHASDEGDPYDGVLDLAEGHACMVVPLYAGERTLGAITLDGEACGAYSSEAVRLAGVGGELVSLALLLAEQVSLLDHARDQLAEHNRLLTEELTGGENGPAAQLLSSQAPVMRQLVQLATQVAASDLPVLLLGETGTGKEVLAQAIHGWSRRAAGPFVKLNCSALPEALVESELFGHVKGAFSGADRDRKGRFVTANGGTLLLDEIGDMPLSAQAKLLRVLQEGTLEPVGSDATVRVDVRIIAATHVDLAEAVRERRFREDLYFRLAVFPLRLPPLRERREDVVPIAQKFLEHEARRTRRGPWQLSQGAVDALSSAPLRGNVRELLSALSRAVILRPQGALTAADLGLFDAPRAQTASRPQGQSLPTFEEAERAYLSSVLEHTKGKLYGDDGAAAITGLPPSTLRSRLVKLGLR